MAEQLTPDERAEAVRRFTLFREYEASVSSPLYTVFCTTVVNDLNSAGPLGAVLAAAPARQRIPNLLFAAVHRVLFDSQDDPIAQYYPSLGGSREPDTAVAELFTAFVLAHRTRIEQILATAETQTNEVLRAAQIYPALLWAQRRSGRPLGLIEVGTSAGLLLHAEEYAYRYLLDDGSVFAAGAGTAEGMPVLECRAYGESFPADSLRVVSRTGLDINPLNPADLEARAWLEALVWPEHHERRARLVAALDHAARHQVTLIAGDALETLPKAVESLPADALACIFVSNSFPHWTKPARAEFVRLVRRLGAARDLMCIVKEAYPFGLGLFTGTPRGPVPDNALTHEIIGAAEYRNGHETLWQLGGAGQHGVGIWWSPRIHA